MIDCARLVFSVGSARASSFRQQADKSYISLTPTSADLNAAPGSRPNYYIAYRISTVHDCYEDEHAMNTASGRCSKSRIHRPPQRDAGETDGPRRYDI
jgi:hypothetical protein